MAGMISATNNMKTVSDSSTVIPGKDGKREREKNKIKENIDFHHFQQILAWREFLHLKRRVFTFVYLSH